MGYSMEGLYTIETFICGWIAFPALFYSLASILQTQYGDKFSEQDAYTIANRSVSLLQAVMSCVAGVSIVTSCQDIMNDCHWMTKAYCPLTVSYMYYDAWAMYEAYRRKQENPELLRKDNVVGFLKKNALM